jgi:hypothetical protein
VTFEASPLLQKYFLYTVPILLLVLPKYQKGRKITRTVKIPKKYPTKGDILSFDYL